MIVKSAPLQVQMYLDGSRDATSDVIPCLDRRLLAFPGSDIIMTPQPNAITYHAYG